MTLIVTPPDRARRFFYFRRLIRCVHGARVPIVSRSRIAFILRLIVTITIFYVALRYVIGHVSRMPDPARTPSGANVNVILTNETIVAIDAIVSARRERAPHMQFTRSDAVRDLIAFGLKNAHGESREG